MPLPQLASHCHCGRSNSGKARNRAEAASEAAASSAPRVSTVQYTR